MLADQEMTTTELWEKLHDDRRHQLRYPSEHVVRWLASLGSYGTTTALDIGCGSGRHLRVLTDFGCVPVGVDTSMELMGKTPGIYHGDMCDLPFDDARFDLALSYGVFYYGTRKQHLQAVREMHRVLKPGGHGLVVTRTFFDSRRQTGEYVDKHTRRMTDGDEQGMLINFLRAGDIQKDYGVFSDVSFELSETTRDERRWRDSDWVIRVQK